MLEKFQEQNSEKNSRKMSEKFQTQNGGNISRSNARKVSRTKWWEIFKKATGITMKMLIKFHECFQMEFKKKIRETFKTKSLYEIC